MQVPTFKTEMYCMHMESELTISSPAVRSLLILAASAICYSDTQKVHVLHFMTGKNIVLLTYIG